MYRHWHLSQLVDIGIQHMEMRNIKKFRCRAYNTSSTEYLLRKELLHLEKMFIDKNNYPCWVIKQILTQVENNKKEIT